MHNLSKIGYPNYAITTSGEVYSFHSKRFLRGWIDIGGYRKVSLSNGRGFSQVFVHRLLAEMFLSNPEAKPQVNHLDGNKLNNELSNLEWVTEKENTDHAYQNRLNPGKNNGENTLPSKVEGDSFFDPYDYENQDSISNEEEVRFICDLISQGYRDVDISKMTNLNRRYINLLRHNSAERWKEVVGEYQFSFKKEERMSPEKVLEICKFLEEGLGVLEVARRCGTHRKNVGNIKARKTFKEISSAFNF